MGVALEHRDAFVVFLRGTCTRAEGLADVNGKLRKYDEFPGAIHRGFMGTYADTPCLRLQAKKVHPLCLPRSLDCTAPALHGPSDPVVGVFVVCLGAPG